MIARLQLAKVPLCLFIGFAALFGAVLASPVLSLQALLVAVGVFVVATGAASLNSLQELQLDGRMARTRNRPLPTGLLTPVQAGCQALFLLLLGLLIIAAGAEELLPAAVTVGAVVLYNGVYTPLKQKSILAIVPGALCGALPAYIGWLAGGGGAAATASLIIALFVLWQIPHFWLVILSYREDYVAGSLPNLLSRLDEKGLKRLMVTWIVALSSVMLMFGALPYPLSTVIRYGVVANSLLLPAVFFYWLTKNPANYRFLFIALNCALLLHMVLICAGRIAGE